MMFKKSGIYIITYFLLLMLSACGGENNHDKGQSLVYLQSIPSDLEDNYMKNPVNMVLSGDSTLYVSSHYISKIFQFSFIGELLHTIGGEGKGPGEFNMQLGIDLLGENLVVMDQGNLRVQILDPQGVPAQTFLTKDVFHDFETHNDTIYAFTIHPFRQLDASHRQNLIKVLDRQGNRLFSFGDYLFHGEEGMTEVASFSGLRIHNRKLYVLYMYFPLMQVYNLQGKLLDEVIFDEAKFDRLAGGSNDPRTAQKGNRIEMKSLYKTFWVDDSGIYLGLLEDYLKIDHHTPDGEFVRSYIWEEVSDPYYLKDIQIIENDSGDRHLFVLNTDEYPVIHVFDME